MSEPRESVLMSEQPQYDSVPADAESAGPLTRRQRLTRFAVAAIPLIIIIFFFTYLWWVSGVLPHVERFANGKPRVTGYVKRDGVTYHRTGRWVSFHANGQKASEGFYERDVKTPGTWQYWDDAGNELPAEPQAYETTQNAVTSTAPVD